jgi:hypothetical protein
MIGDDDRLSMRQRAVSAELALERAGSDFRQRYLPYPKTGETALIRILCITRKICAIMRR